MVKQLFALACGVILFLLSNAVGADDFDVLVMRGSTLVRVTGDENGPTSEVTIREDPTPPAPEPVWERADVPTESVELVIQVFRNDPMPIFGRGFGHGHPVFVRNDKSRHGFARAMARDPRNPSGFVRHDPRGSASGGLFHAMKGRSAGARVGRPVALAWGAR